MCIRDSMEDADGERGFKKIYTGPANPHGDVTWNIPGMNIGYGELKAIEAYEMCIRDRCTAPL